MSLRLPYCFLVLSLIAGCGKGSAPTTSAPPAKDTPAGKPKPTTPAAKPEIDLEVQPLEVEKGKSVKYTVGVDRKKFAGDVQVVFESEGLGIKVEPATIPAGKNSVEVTVTADAKVGSGKLKITGSSKGVDPYEVYIGVNVK